MAGVRTGPRKHGNQLGVLEASSDTCTVPCRTDRSDFIFLSIDQPNLTNIFSIPHGGSRPPGLLGTCLQWPTVLQPWNSTVAYSRCVQPVDPTVA